MIELHQNRFCVWLNHSMENYVIWYQLQISMIFSTSSEKGCFVQTTFSDDLELFLLENWCNKYHIEWLSLCHLKWIWFIYSSKKINQKYWFKTEINKSYTSFLIRKKDNLFESNILIILIVLCSLQIVYLSLNKRNTIQNITEVMVLFVRYSFLILGTGLLNMKWFKYSQKKTKTLFHIFISSSE